MGGVHLHRASSRRKKCAVFRLSFTNPTRFRERPTGSRRGWWRAVLLGFEDVRCFLSQGPHGSDRYTDSAKELQRPLIERVARQRPGSLRRRPAHGPGDGAEARGASGINQAMVNPCRGFARRAHSGHPPGRERGERAASWRTIISAKNIPAHVTTAFHHAMEEVYSAADFAIARSGRGQSGGARPPFSLPAILIPFPYAAEDHQTRQRRDFRPPPRPALF